jgi:uncharacterized membrane protein (UPF0182 family)
MIAMFWKFVVSLLVAALFLVNIFRRHWVIPVIGAGLMVVSALVVGSLYPLFVQQFQVRPSELVKEQPYIERNIVATRDAYAVANTVKEDYAGTVEGRQKDYRQLLDDFLPMFVDYAKEKHVV